MKRPLVTIAILIILIGCSDKEQAPDKKGQTSLPSDFYFEMEFGRPKSNAITDNFNSKNSTFHRRYSYGDTVIQVALTKNDLHVIYLSFVTSDFFNLPNEIHQDMFLARAINMTDISMFGESQLKKIRCFNYENFTETPELRRFEKIRTTILNILESEKTYQSLKPADLVGL